MVIQELKRKVVTSVLDWEVLRENLKQTFRMTNLRSRIHLEEIMEGFQLNFQKIRIRHLLLHCREIDSLVLFLFCHIILWFNIFENL